MLHTSGNGFGSVERKPQKRNNFHRKNRSIFDPMLEPSISSNNFSINMAFSENKRNSQNLF